MDNARVVADGAHGRRDRGGNKINAGGVGAAGGGHAADGIGNAGRITQILAIRQRAGIAISPAAAGDRRRTKQRSAVVDANRFTRPQGSGEGTADR